MNKTQKQLIDTYFRKRNIAHQNNDNRKYYELQYMMKNNIEIGELNDVETFLINPDTKITIGKYDFLDNEIADILMQRPEMVNRFNKDVLYALQSFYVFKILKNRLELYPYFNLSELRDSQMYRIVTSNPSKLNIIVKIPKFVESLGKLDTSEITHLFKKAPNIFEYGIFDLKKLSEYDITEILMKRPEYINKLNYKILSSYNIIRLLTIVPSLYNYFKDADLNIYIPELLDKQPSLIDKIDYDKVNDLHLTSILSKHPQAFRYLSTERIKNLNVIHSKLISNNKNILNEKRFIDYLNTLDEFDLYMLISDIPKLIDILDTSKLSKSMLMLLHDKIKNNRNNNG